MPFETSSSVEPAAPTFARRLPAAIALLALVLTACTGSTQGPGWTFAPIGTQAAPSPTEKPFSGRMSRHTELIDGYVSMYMSLENTGNEPLTFLNTLYDSEPTMLYRPTVAYPYADGTTALTTRDGRFFPSPSIVQPGERAVYIMGGRAAKGSGTLDEPVANIKFCPTRGMDDIPGVPIDIRDVTWTTADGLTTVSGTLVETQGSRRQTLPTVGVAFFDGSGAFVGAVVADRVGLRLKPGEMRPFEISGRGVAADKIVTAEAYGFIP